MTSLLVTFCYVSSVSSTEKTINGVASYKAGKDDYRDVIFKGFISSSGLISNFSKGSIVLFVGRFVYDENDEYVCI